MSLHNLPTTITPAEHNALYNAVIYAREAIQAKRNEALAQRGEMSKSDQYLYDNCETAALWLAAQSEKLYKEWDALPEGSHLKEAYAEQVWTWSDRDLAATPEPDHEDWNFVKPERPGDAA